jgi:CubicO group peptidase (beta-lactamase class C family)
MKKNKLLLVTLLLLFVSSNPGAKENSLVLIDKLVPNNVRLTNNISSGTEFAPAEKTVNAFLRKWSIEGASMAVAKDGKLIFAKGFGYADTASKTEAQPYSRFRIASISKLVQQLG